MPNGFLYHDENKKNNNAKGFSGTPRSSSAGSSYHELYGNEFTRSFDSRRFGEASSSVSTSSDCTRNYGLQKFGRGNWSNSSGSSSYETYRCLHSPASQEADGSGWSSNSVEELEADMGWLRFEMKQSSKQWTFTITITSKTEVLSSIRHPNLVILLGACPEYGCLVYECMSEGSLEDRLFSKNNGTPLPWQLRFKIAAEIATALHFLHLIKPEPVVHRDLKPGNILLDQSFVSKISDVCLSRLIPFSSVDAISQYKMTAASGTFCYIDPEYQKTGLLGVKSDIYAFGIILMQLLTAKPPMGLAHSVEIAMESRSFHEMLDHSVHDWPVKESMELGKLALRCAELRRKDRPEMETILRELERFQQFADESLHTVEHFLKANSSERQIISLVKLVYVGAASLKCG